MSEKELESLFDTKEQALFFICWMKNGRVAWKAYKELHSTVSDTSCRVLGSRMLTNINISTILSAYDLGFDKYFDELKGGLSATFINHAGHQVPDYKVRRSYHKVLGSLLGIEKSDKEKQMQAQQDIVYIPPSWFTPPQSLSNNTGFSKNS